MFLTKEILRDSPMWQEIEDEARTEGLAKGLAKGRAEGREEGRAEGERRALTMILTRRFGPIPSELETRISGASLETLERWINQAIVAGSLEASLD